MQNCETPVLSILLDDSDFVGFNEICANEVCECFRNSQGDCFGPYIYCPSHSLQPGLCNAEVRGSVCIEETSTCECPDGQVQIARACVNTTGNKHVLRQQGKLNSL